MVISFLSGFLSHRRVVIVHLFSRALLYRSVFVPSADSLLFFSLVTGIGKEKLLVQMCAGLFFVFVFVLGLAFSYI